jgi:hypothetical protein
MAKMGEILIQHGRAMQEQATDHLPQSSALPSDRGCMTLHGH